MEYEPTMKKCETCGDFDFINEVHKCEEKETLCGACGQFFNETEAEVGIVFNTNEYQLMHSAKFCDVALDESAEKQLTPDEIHLAMIEDVSNIVAKYFPNFDNNIEDQTWSFLVLFIEETIHQLGKETKQMKCDLCKTTEKLLTESDKATLRPNWAGVDFYNAICIPCWNAQKDIR